MSMLVWKKAPMGYISSYFMAKVMRKADFMVAPSNGPEMMRLRFRVEKTRYEKTWQLELIHGGNFKGDVLAANFRTAKDAMGYGNETATNMGGVTDGAM
jgi:hypothetical protein